MKLHYELTCLATGETLSDDGLPLANPAADKPAFLRTSYRDKSFVVGPPEDGIYRFAQWLPIRKRLSGSSAPVTYRSSGLAEKLGLERLYITFTGFWPERGCRALTGTFKECEAYSVCARMPDDFGDVLVVASAGNTARAFARVCSENEIPLVVVIPERNLDSLWSVGPLSDSVRIIAAGGDSDYSDAIALAGVIASLDGFAAEGGAKNVARRDGMGTTVLSAAHEIGEIPHHYFQAVGSGTGAIAAWEANLRLIASGQFEPRRMRLHVSQNAPFAPIHNSWQARSRDLLPLDEHEAKRQIAEIQALVLANRKPPYSLIGGLFDALSDTNGTTDAVDNGAGADAAELFYRTEGVDVSPAAAIAVAGLVRAVQRGDIPRDEIVMLNVTGGGLDLIHQHEDMIWVKPARTITPEHFDAQSVRKIVQELF
jgi:cysteate synthase